MRSDRDFTHRSSYEARLQGPRNTLSVGRAYCDARISVQLPPVASTSSKPDVRGLQRLQILDQVVLLTVCEP